VRHCLGFRRTVHPWTTPELFAKVLPMTDEKIIRTMIGAVGEQIGQNVVIKGWIDTIRNQKKIQFLIVRDKSGTVQVTHLKGEKADKLGATIDDLTLESAVVIKGKLVKNEQVNLRGMEIVAESIEIINLAETPLPIDEKTGLDGRLEWRFLDLRNPRNLNIFKVQTATEHAMRVFWQREGFVEMHSPKLMGSASESGAELFELEYFGKKAYLAQSPQFYKQMAMSAGFDKVFEIGPVFRANPSFTTRHDTEFTSIDMEISWIDSHEDIMELEERWLHHTLKSLKESHGEMIKESFGVDVVVPELPFPRITMEEAQKIVEDSGHKLERDGDLDPEGERIVARHIADKHGHEFVFVTDYPTKVRPFYHMRQADHPELTKSYDLLWQGLEVTTGAQREHRVDVLQAQAKENGISAESIQFYLDFFRYGCPSHGGFGFGLTRMLMILLGFKNVREVTYLYRGPNRLSP